MDAAKILNVFYPGVSAIGAQTGRARRVWSIVRNIKKARSTTRTWTPYLVIGSLVVAAWFVVHLYYYNLLVSLDFDVKGAWAQVETQLERRHNIQQNLTQIVMNYSKYEKETLNGLIEMRTSAMAGGGAARPRDANRRPASESSPPSSPAQLEQMTKSELEKLFPSILLVAEQYPELKLTENFQQFSAAIVDTESQIAERTMEFNTAVNTYTTVRTQFPGNFFAATFGFPEHDFYTPDEELLEFKPVKY